ncbi:MAG: 2Fe-2S iron-sulfur cluster-binding protein [Burkholderiaceae bacterium]
MSDPSTPQDRRAAEADDRHARAAGPRLSRRSFMQSSVAALTAAGTRLGAAVPAASQPSATSANGTAPARPVTLQINGKRHDLMLEPRVTLLDALREVAGMTGTKKGCDHGQCGACTVLVDGERIDSCLTLAIMQEGREITTVEGLAQGETLHPVQAAFLDHDAFQCGYCTPGQICSAVALLDEVRAGDASTVTPDVRSGKVALTDAEIRERMSGNICRCGAYPNIVAAIRAVAENKS